MGEAALGLWSPLTPRCPLPGLDLLVLHPHRAACWPGLELVPNLTPQVRSRNPSCFRVFYFTDRGDSLVTKFTAVKWTIGGSSHLQSVVPTPPYLVPKHVRTPKRSPAHPSGRPHPLSASPWPSPACVLSPRSHLFWTFHLHAVCPVCLWGLASPSAVRDGRRVCQGFAPFYSRVAFRCVDETSLF